MIIRMETRTVYYPISRRQLIHGSGRVQHVRGFLLVKPKTLK
jgi:hypothetical protein